ncbi:25.3 kDa vesicle transport protein SEC22-1 isoform X2 [Physcomitrium patens]|uniref:25.3 kDa vesicle transport protein SEC22-1 isoform X2 n=1 Tax=Physcomitrium patens TaxID=3218 RepID=UPI000D173BA5|nr:25.3 kDa vesicle transport protein-like isoform X2 [Physcomitrium patens]|eukprot:XP_024369299.1 25.3 kDa vesicle transport protein-like isoform X2 [Physcomitrella patens]
MYIVSPRAGFVSDAPEPLFNFAELLFDERGFSIRGTHRNLDSFDCGPTNAHVWLREGTLLTVELRESEASIQKGLDDGREQNDMEFYKQQAKQLCKELSRRQHEASRMSVETGPYFFHYIIEGGVCYLTLCERSYPKKLAYQYLEELQREFEKVNRSQIETVARPYAFIKFDTFIQKTRKLYQDTRTQRNLSKLNDDLYEVTQIMTRNIQEVLGVGDRLDHIIRINVNKDTDSPPGSKRIFYSIMLREIADLKVSQMSSRLATESKVYSDKAKDLNRQALIRKWAPVGIVIGVVLLLLWFRRSFWS